MYKNEILIRNFGPIDEARIDLNDKFQIFIGAQASGKSTICRVVYFLQNKREYKNDFNMIYWKKKKKTKKKYFKNMMSGGLLWNHKAYAAI